MLFFFYKLRLRFKHGLLRFFEHYFFRRRVARRMGRLSGVLGGANGFICCGVPGMPGAEVGVAAPPKLLAPPFVAAGAADGLPKIFDAAGLPKVNGLATLLLCGVDVMPPKANGVFALPAGAAALLLLLLFVLKEKPPGLACCC